MDDPPEGMRAREYDLTLQGIGVTLLGVLASIGVTVGFSMTGPWWLRAVAGAAATVGLALFVRGASVRTTSLRRLARWLTRAGA